MKRFRTNVKFCFASEFTAARHMAGFSIANVAKMLGRDQRTIRNWESGAQPCPSWALRLLLLESRYMDAAYRLQTPRAYESMHLGRGMPANDAIIEETRHPVLVYRDDGLTREIRPAKIAAS